MGLYNSVIPFPLSVNSSPGCLSYTEPRRGGIGGIKREPTGSSGATSPSRRPSVIYVWSAFPSGRNRFRRCLLCGCCEEGGARKSHSGGWFMRDFKRWGNHSDHFTWYGRQDPDLLKTVKISAGACYWRPPQSLTLTSGEAHCQGIYHTQGSQESVH